MLLGNEKKAMTQSSSEQNNEQFFNGTFFTCLSQRFFLPKKSLKSRIIISEEQLPLSEQRGLLLLK